MKIRPNQTLPTPIKFLEALREIGPALRKYCGECTERRVSGIRDRRKPTFKPHQGEQQ